MRLSKLEYRLHSELNLPWGIALPGNNAELSRGQRHIGGRKNDLIQQIECLAAELDRQMIGSVEVLEQ